MRPIAPPWLVALCLVACSSPPERTTELAEVTARPPVATTPDPLPATADANAKATPDPARGWVDPPRTHVLLLRHAPEAADFEVLPIALADPPTLLPAHRLPALPRADWPGHFTAVATHGGGGEWAHAGGREGAWTLVARGPSPGAAVREVEVGAVVPAAMHMVGSVVLVGAGNTVGTVDLAADAPRWRVLHERPDMKFKAYDLFARDGARLVAIDDEVMPMYADAFDLDARGHATHRAGWALPGVINGHYHAAVLATGGSRSSGTLWVVASYGIMDGHGQDLAALAIEGDALRVGAEVTLNSHAMEDPPVLEEHVSRHTGKPEKLAFGSDYTPWTGLARVRPATGPAWLLLAAGPRGLLRVPERFGPSTRAEAIDVGGECADVMVVGERVLVLVVGPAPALVELRPTAAGLEPGPRLPLPETFCRGPSCGSAATPAAQHRFVR